MENRSTSCERLRPSWDCWPTIKTRKWNGHNILRTSSRFRSRLSRYTHMKQHLSIDRSSIDFFFSLSFFCIQSRIRELERKMELQNVRHDELLLELAALRRNQHHHHASNSSGGGSSHHGSSQSLGAAFDLDSRGSSPGSY